MTGARSIAALVAWKTGSSPTNAQTIATVAHRLPEFPRCAAGMREGRLSLDQVGIIAKKAAAGSDEHYATLAEVATVNQLDTALKAANHAPNPNPQPEPTPERSITKTSDEQSTTWKIKLGPVEAATFDAALASHQDALITEWKRDHDGCCAAASDQWPPLPNTGDAFMSLVEAGWDAEAARRPQGQRTTVVVHLDVKDQRRAAASGAATHRDRPPIPDLRRHLRSVVPPRRTGHRRRAHHPHHQPPATSCPGIPPPHLRGSRMRGHPRSARPPHPALGRRRAYRTAQPRAAVPVSPPPASPRHHHHHRTTGEPDDNRQ